jgi:tRNA-specific 2-thiouridylase
MATGHYARIGHCASNGQLQLLRGIDAQKDQSYFLASMHGQSLAGGLLTWHGLRPGSIAMAHNLTQAAFKDVTAAAFEG